MIVGAPIAVAFMLIAWLLLTKVLYKPEITEIPGGAELIRSERRKLGPISSGEVRVLLIFLLAALSWVRSEEHTSELQSRGHLVCRLLLEKKKYPTRATHRRPPQMLANPMH